MKPEPEIYRVAVAESGCEAEECFFVDDLAENVEAARREGMCGAVFVGVEPLRVALIERESRPLASPAERRVYWGGWEGLSFPLCRTQFVFPGWTTFPQEIPR
ncbi:MAG: hypothetical protein CM1200mP2_52240 [Planctomycetaceae bacterium]|nr:MAG: hypothetical protein CM1200mP2_52240 [Planctomycetaceae bacterium]